MNGTTHGQGNTISTLLEKIRMVGREAQVNQYLDWLTVPGRQLVFYTGEAGMGKTWLLRHLIKATAGKSGPGLLLVPAPSASQIANLEQVELKDIQVVDLYHTTVHSPEGLMRFLLKKLPENEPALKSCRKSLDRLDAARTGRDTGKADAYLQTALDAFANGMAKISKKRKVVIFMDTAERWVYSQKPDVHLAEAWDWLQRVVTGMDNVLLLMAGREPCLELKKDAGAKGLPADHVRLDGFERSGINEYVDEIWKFPNVGHLTEAEQDALAALSGGRPIVLALVLMLYLQFQGGGSPLAELVSLNSGPEAERLERFEKRLVERLMSWPQVAEVLRTLGRAPKGVDEDLLAALMNVDLKQARQYMEMMSGRMLVKQYSPGDEKMRLFLHDYIYELLRKYVYSDYNDLSERQAAYQTIRKYYDDRLHEVAKQLNGIFIQARTSHRLEPEKLKELADLENYRQRLYGEVVYYSLRYERLAGVKRFARYVHESVVTNSPQAFIPLEIEFSAYLDGLDVLADEAPDTNERLILEQIRKFLPQQASFARGKFGEGARLARELRLASLGSGSGDLVDIGSQVWEGFHLIFAPAGDDDIDELLAEGIKNAHALLDSRRELEHWYARYLEGLGLRARGLYARIQGRFADTKALYRKALSIWYRLDLKVEEAFTRNDLGFALSETGEFNEALPAIRKALEIREGLGLGRNIGLSLNTLAHFYLRQGNYEEARNLADQALTLFMALDDNLYRGLALIAKAEAVRRLAVNKTLTPKMDKRLELLKEALSLSTDADELYAPNKLNQPARYVEALIEKGCAGRDLIATKIHMGDLATDEQSLQLLKDSEASLLEAANQAADNRIVFRQVDAMVDRAWLMYFCQRSKEEIQAAIMDALHAIPEEYHILNGKEPAISREKATGLVWSHAGKLYTLRGHCAMDDWNVVRETNPAESDARLQDAVKFYYHALRYNCLFSDRDRGMQLARQHVLDKIEPLILTDREKIAAILMEIESEYGDSSSNLQNYLFEQALWPF